MNLWDFSEWRPARTERHYHTSVATVTERRAPTDESVRLLKEFEEAARDKIVASFRLSDCPLDVAVAVYRDTLCARYTVAMHYRINGQPRKAEAYVDRVEYADLDSIAQSMQKALVTDLSHCILEQCFTDVVAAVVAR